MFQHRPFLFFCLVLLLQAQSVCHADAAYLQPESVYLGDISELVIEFDNRIPSLYPLDTSALEANFEILDKKSRVFRLTDGGEIVHRMQWRVQLLPRKSGRLEVPELHIFDNSTPVLKLEVIPVPSSLQASHNVFIEMKADNPTPYVGQQTQIDIQLFRNTSLSDGRLFEPEVSGALTFHPDEEQTYTINRNGQEFHVLNRGIALFPQAAGELHLLPANYRGKIDSGKEAPQAESGLALRTIARRSNSLNLQVRNPPAEFSGRFWLPASRLEISQSWDQPGKEIKVGDSLDWTLTIVAHGLPAESLPVDLLTMESANLRIYADQPTHSNRLDGKWLIGRLDQRFAVIASQPGVIVLPEILLKWWDVDSDSEKQVRVEGRTINVLATPIPVSTATRDIIGALQLALADDSRYWLWPLLLVVVISAISLLQTRITAFGKAVLRRRRLIRQLNISCLSDDAASTRNALLAWGRERWHGQTINGLYQIGNNIESSELSAELQQLDAALYSRHDTDWNGQALWRLIAAVNRRAGKKPNLARDLLPRLYPV